MSVRDNIANFLTLVNLMCGFLAILFVMNGDVVLACYLVIAGGVFDFIDGFAARLLKITSELGKQLDSLSDLVTFGVVPGLIAYILLRDGLDRTQSELAGSAYIQYLPLLIPVFSAFRLGKFNIDTRQSTNFLGMPTPANGLLWISFPLILHQLSDREVSSFYQFVLQAITHPYFLIGAILVSSIIMVVEIPLFGFKFTNLSKAQLILRILFIALAFILFGIMKFVAVPIIIILYVLFSIITTTQLNRNEV